MLEHPSLVDKTASVMETGVVYGTCLDENIESEKNRALPMAMQAQQLPVVFNVVGSHSGVGHPVVDHSVHANRHRITRKDLDGQFFLFITALRQKSLLHLE